MQVERSYYANLAARLTRCVALFSSITIALALASCGSGVTRPGLTENAIDVEEARMELVGADSELLPSRNLDHGRQVESFFRVVEVVRPAALRVCHRLQAQNCEAIESKDPKIVRDDSFNAYADINDQVGMNSGLLKRAGSDDEIAFVLAHEYGHVMAAHPSTKATNASIGALIGGVLGALADSSICRSAEECNYTMTEALAGTGATIGAVAYSEDQELEADYYAGLILAEAGIDLHAGNESLARIALMSGERSGEATAFAAMLRTHPLGDRRLARWTINRRALEYATAMNLQDDNSLIRDAAQRAASGDAQSPVHWANPKSGSSGAVWTDGDWTTIEGRTCRRTIWRNDNRTLDDRLRKGILNVCRAGS
ncbi:MAG: M48 family metalloprotease [Albidovulum sp.]|nr:M48 family metalloprotease [Albidovulum sp.]MDE0532165.1 M48 family metalloprotease [Albidovulum sp.]